jgi:uncharacterized protein Yka (UPF0111/DUF47 family)
MRDQAREVDHDGVGLQGDELLGGTPAADTWCCRPSASKRLASTWMKPLSSSMTTMRPTGAPFAGGIAAKHSPGSAMPSRGRTDRQLLRLFVESGENVLHVAGLLRDLVVSWPDAGRLPEQIVAAEHEGDRLTHETLQRLAEHGSPLDASDVHALAGALDDIVDHSEEAADRIGLYRVEAAMDQAIAMTDVLVLAASGVVDALRGLEAGADLSGQLIEIHRLENEADRLVREAVAGLFVDGIDPMTVIRWKDIYDTLEAAVDSCETVANVLEGMQLKRR